jgi:hypothetical protein
MTETTIEDPARIEQDIRQTQDQMSRTVDRLGDQLTLKNIFNALLDKADENNVDARYLVDGARRNPVALGLIAAGTIWLVSDKDSKFPSLPGRKSQTSDGSPIGEDVHHRDYVAHMSAVEMREGEDPLAYTRRRDIARSNFFMIERNHDEDDQGFRQRLDSIADKFREKRRAWSDSAAQAGTATKEQGRRAASRVQDMYDTNPLVGGMLAAVVGAALGSSLPITRQEQDKLGRIGEKARDAAGEQTQHLTSEVRKTKDALLERADQALEPAHSRSRDDQTDPGAAQGSQSPGETPFIIGDDSR